jgi:hypothetical protein
MGLLRVREPLSFLLDGSCLTTGGPPADGRCVPLQRPIKISPYQTLTTPSANAFPVLAVYQVLAWFEVRGQEIVRGATSAIIWPDLGTTRAGAGRGAWMEVCAARPGRIVRSENGCRFCQLPESPVQVPLTSNARCSPVRTRGTCNRRRRPINGTPTLSSKWIPFGRRQSGQ